MMNKMTNDNIVEEALSQLNMKYRSVTYKKSLIYFVTTENGTIFDISIGENGKIRFWKFINPELLTEKARKGVEYRKTKNGKILKSSTIFIRDDSDKIIGIFGINYDISLMLAMEKELSSFTGTIEEDTTKEPIAVNIGDLLDELISQSVRHIGKPVTLMTKEDKVQVVRLLNEAGAFLITKSGPKVCQFLGISKYTLYSYLDEIKSKNTI